MLRPYGSPCPDIRHDATQLHHMAADLNAELPQQDLADGPAGDPRDGLAGAGALQDVAGAAAVAALAAFQLRVHALGGHGEAGGDPLEDRHQAAAVRFARCREPESHLLAAPPITGEPDRGRARASVLGPEAARHYGLPHREGRPTGNGFGITGSCTMTTPLAVTPNS